MTTTQTKNINWYYIGLVIFYIVFGTYGHGVLGQEDLFNAEVMKTSEMYVFISNFSSWHMHTLQNACFGLYFIYAARTSKPYLTIHAVWLAAAISITRPLAITIGILIYAPSDLIYVSFPLLLNVIALILMWFGVRKVKRDLVAS